MTETVSQRANSHDQRQLRAHVTRRIEAEGIRKVRVATVDLNGVPRAKLVTAEQFVARVMERGHPWALPLIAVDIWQNLPEGVGYGAGTGFGNGILVPDLTTFRKLPWTADTAHVFGDVYTREGEATPTPRNVLKAVLERAGTLGWQVVFGSELEFYIFRPGDGSHPSHPGFVPYAGMQVWFTDQGIGQAQGLLDELHRCLEALDVPIYEMFNEHGGGQFEFNLSPAAGVGAIDAVCLMKLAIKEVCALRGLRATFMGRPDNDPERPVSGYHLHQCLLDGEGGNVFLDAGAPLCLSETGRHYIGGLLAHAMALTGLSAPTVTAYKRFTPGTWAPTRASWGFDNRTAMIRVIPGDAGPRIENRLASAEANPYVLAAAMTAAGMDGVEKRTSPGEVGQGNLLEDTRFAPVPTTLIDGAEAVAGDRVMVEALGADFTRLYVGLLRHVWRRFMSHVTDWEIKEYRDLL
jgi:glutamine synthetase